MKLEIDAEFASLIPAMDAEEYAQLEANIVAEGCRDPLVVWGNILIDGHNRLRICEKYDIQYQVVGRSFADRDEAIQYIILNQFGRRNLSVADRSLLALKLEPSYKAQAKKNQQKSQGRGIKGTQHDAYLFSGETRLQIAKIAGVSHTTIDRVKSIATEGTPEHIERIRQGGKGNSIRAVYFEVRGKQQPALEDAAAPTAPPEPDAPADTMKPPQGRHIPESLEDDTALVDDTPSGELLDEEPETCEDELEQIKRYVAELKNPDLNRSYTTEMFVVEYEAFAERFIRSLGIFGGAPYSEIYPLLSDGEKETLSALSAAMVRAIQKQNILIKG